MAFSTLRRLLVLAIAMAGFGLNAYSLNQFTVDGLTYVSQNGTTAAVFNSADTMTVVNIPETVEYEGVVYDVTGLLGIGEEVTYLRVPPSVVNFDEGNDACLFHHPNLNTLSIGSPNIPEGVFRHCYQLKNIIFEATVRTIGFRAFECSLNLMTVTFLSSDIEYIYGFWNEASFEGRLGYTEDTPRLIKVRVPQGAVSKFKGKIRGYIVEQSETDSYADFIDGGIAYRVTTDEAYVTGCTANTRDLVIPASVISPEGNTYSVVGLDRFAVSFHEHLRTVSLPQSVVSIDKQAFVRNCDVESITVAEGNPAYSSQGCNVLLNTAEGELLYACKNAVIPPGTLRIGNRAFADCPVMSQPIVFPTSVKSIGDSAFYKNTSLGSDLQLDGDLESIGRMAFARCTGIESVTIGTHVSSIGYRALRYCDKLTRMNYNAKNCSVSTGYVLNDGEVMDDLHWLSTSEYMPENNRSALSEVVVGDAVEVLPEKIFLEQVKLKRVDLPASLQVIGTGAFDGCERLDTLICRAIVPPAWNESHISGTLNVNKGVLQVPSSSLEQYRVWPWTWFIIKTLDAIEYDINSDGKIDIADVNITINYMLGKGDPRYTQAECDFNNDGTVDITDVNFVINLMLGKPTSSTPPTPPGNTYTVNGVSFRMVAVEGGTFTMGGINRYGEFSLYNQFPAHEMTVESFSIGQTEVTQELWQAVMGSNPSQYTGDLQRPVESVSWEDCQEFLTRLNQLAGVTFRLPSEAEWEYAAMGGNKTHRYSYAGSNNPDEVAWHFYNSNNGAYPHPVAMLAPNELGLYDMSGNVEEWCQDSFAWYDEPVLNNNVKILRGGNFRGSAQVCTVKIRSSLGILDAEVWTGFRLAITDP